MYTTVVVTSSVVVGSAVVVGTLVVSRVVTTDVIMTSVLDETETKLNIKTNDLIIKIESIIVLNLCLHFQENIITF